MLKGRCACQETQARHPVLIEIEAAVQIEGGLKALWVSMMYLFLQILKGLRQGGSEPGNPFVFHIVGQK